MCSLPKIDEDPLLCALDYRALDFPYLLYYSSSSSSSYLVSSCCMVRLRRSAENFCLVSGLFLRLLVSLWIEQGLDCHNGLFIVDSVGCWSGLEFVSRRTMRHWFWRQNILVANRWLRWVRVAWLKMIVLEGEVCRDCWYRGMVWVDDLVVKTIVSVVGFCRDPMVWIGGC